MTASLDDLCTSSAWWAALRLDERAPGSVPDDPDAARRGQARLASWRTDKAVTGGHDVDLTRWRRKGIDDHRLALLLGETTESLRDRLPERPAWLDVLTDAYTRTDQHRHAHDPHAAESAGGPTAPPVESFGLLELVRPLGQHHHDLLRSRIAEAQQRHGNQETVDDAHPVLRPDLTGLAGMITATLVREMHLRGDELPGETPEARFASFAESLRDPVTAVRLLSRYPVLAREVVEELTTWVEVRATFTERLLAALPDLADLLGVETVALNDIADVSFGAGDTHNGGQTVAIVELADGHKVVYKPRSIAVERHFYDLVAWLNARGMTHPLRQLKVLDRDSHGWTEFVAEAPCADTEAAGRFFWRQGACLALLHMLRAQDMHVENLIAAGEYPVFVDLEAAFQVPPHGSDPEAQTWSMAFVQESVLGVGLLPQRFVQSGSDGPRTVDMSGLTGGPGELTPMPLPHWLDAGTDRMRVARGHLPMSGGQNLPKLDRTAVAVEAFRPHLLAGFETTYRILLAHRDELTAADGPLAAFADDQIRPILRGTMTYARLLLESWHPDVLRDALDRACLFELLARGHKEKLGRAEIVDSECTQILVRDVPSFHTKVGSVDLYDRFGPLVRDFLPMSGMTAITRRLAEMGEADLRRQLWCVEASLNAAQIGETTRQDVVVRRPLAGTGIDRDTALRAAFVLGDRLVETAMRDRLTGRPGWLTLSLVSEQYWNVVPAGFESFSGINGVALFLGWLGEAGGQARHRADAEAIAGMLAEQAGRWAVADSRVLAKAGIGAFTELGSSMLTLAHLGALWQSDVLLKSAAQLVPVLTARFADDEHLDVIAGTAGAALALLALHEVSPDDRTEQALVSAGDTLLAAAENHGPGIGWRTAIGSRGPLLGFSHGASGMAVALARLAAATGHDRFAEAAAAAVRYEHAQFDAEAGNWPDERDITPPGVFMDAWCHGAAGVAIARAELLGHVDIPEVTADLAAAVSRVRRDLVEHDDVTGVGNHSLCHGDLGLVEALHAGGRALGRQDLVDTAQRAARTVAQVVLAGEERCGVPKGMHTPGLMMGIAGIGYGLLRAAEPGVVPNLLALAAPVGRSER